MFKLKVIDVFIIDLLKVKNIGYDIFSRDFMLWCFYIIYLNLEFIRFILCIQ